MMVCFRCRPQHKIEAGAVTDLTLVAAFRAQAGDWSGPQTYIIVRRTCSGLEEQAGDDSKVLHLVISLATERDIQDSTLTSL